MALVLLVRHGQASFGAENYDVLSDLGWEQARALGRWLTARGEQPAAVVHGELERQRDTAAALAEGGGWTLPPRVDTRWDEFDHLGLMSTVPPLPPGHSREQFQAAFAEATRAWAAGETTGFTETFAGFLSRVEAAREEVCATAVERGSAGGPVVVVSSGGPIAAAAATLVAADLPAEATAAVWAALNTVVVNSSVTRLLVGPSGARMLSYNEHGHLDAATRSYR